MASDFISNFKNKKGFTLAEVLITLVIIGVVAALVISPLINTYVESSTVAKVKKGLSILGQAKKLAENQSGPVDGWNFTENSDAESANQFWSYLKPHISLTKDCGADTSCYQNVEYDLNGSSNSQNHNTNSRYYKFVLADGSVMWFRTSQGKCDRSDNGHNNSCAAFFYDVNGSKKPNTMGRDIFLYFMTSDGVYPHNVNDCHKNSVGWGCSGYIIKHSNMNYLH